MDNYKEYLEERMNGMYGAFDSVIMEEFKKNKDKGKKSEFKKSFINYLVFKYEDSDIRYDFKNAKTDKEKKALADKYAADFEEWSKRQKGLNVILGAEAASLGLTVAGATGPANLLLILIWGGLIKTMVNDYDAREKRREEDYNKKHKK